MVLAASSCPRCSCCAPTCDPRGGEYMRVGTGGWHAVQVALRGSPALMSGTTSHVASIVQTSQRMTHAFQAGADPPGPAPVATPPRLAPPAWPPGGAAQPASPAQPHCPPQQLLLLLLRGRPHQALPPLPQSLVSYWQRPRRLQLPPAAAGLLHTQAGRPRAGPRAAWLLAPPPHPPTPNPRRHPPHAGAAAGAAAAPVPQSTLPAGHGRGRGSTEANNLQPRAAPAALLPPQRAK